MFLAEALMDSGVPEQAVSLLHQGASMDITGQVSNRIWQGQNPYRDLWPETLEAPVNIPIPAEVAAQFGWNRLPQEASESYFVPKLISQAGNGQTPTQVRATKSPASAISPAVIQLGEPDQRISAAITQRHTHCAGHSFCLCAPAG